jgi:hypothetical protein
MIILRFDILSDSHTFGFCMNTLGSSVNSRDLGLISCQTYHVFRLNA